MIGLGRVVIVHLQHEECRLFCRERIAQGVWQEWTDTMNAIGANEYRSRVRHDVFVGESPQFLAQLHVHLDVGGNLSSRSRWLEVHARDCIHYPERLSNVPDSLENRHGLARLL